MKSYSFANQVQWDVPSICRFVTVVLDVVGREWIDRGLARTPTRPHPQKLRRGSYLFKPSAHPLVEWFRDFRAVQQEVQITHRMPLSHSLIKLCVLGSALELSRQQRGFERIVRRLRIAREFDGAAFEAEVAAQYVSLEWDVEFVEEGSNKTPDLRVTRGGGESLWVECKRKDMMTARDLKIQGAWQELASSLVRELGPRKLNYLVRVHAVADPERGDAPLLRRLIIETIESGGVSADEPCPVDASRVVGLAGRYDLLAQKLADPDQLLMGQPAQMAVDADFGVVSLEVDPADVNRCRNPLILKFGTALPSDRVSGAVGLLKSAVGQLPKSGPGVVWLRIPDSHWTGNIDTTLDQVDRLLQAELSGDQNRRVNAVFVTTRWFQELERDGLRGLGYSPLLIRIDHTNPRGPVNIDAYHQPKTSETGGKPQ